MRQRPVGDLGFRSAFCYPKNPAEWGLALFFPLSGIGPAAESLPSDAHTSPVGRRKSGGVFVCLDIKPNRVFLLTGIHTADTYTLAVCGRSWRFLRVRRSYRWTEAPWAARQFPLRTTLTSTRKSWRKSQRNTEKTTRQRCLCTHLGRFGWTGNVCPPPPPPPRLFRVVRGVRARRRAGMMEEKYHSRPPLSAGLLEQM